MNKERIVNKKSRQYISIQDQTVWEQIEQLLPYYTTFNKLINDALNYGVPMLMDAKTKPITYEDVAPPVQPQMQKIPGEILDPKIDEVIYLLKEIVLDTSIQRKMINGLFNVKEIELGGGIPNAVRFTQGKYNSTPDCLFEEEINALKDLFGQNDEE